MNEPQIDLSEQQMNLSKAIADAIVVEAVALARAMVANGETIATEIVMTAKAERLSGTENQTQNKEHV